MIPSKVLRKLKIALALMTESDWRTPDPETCQTIVSILQNAGQ